MCLVAPARVIALDRENAVVLMDGRERRASTLLEPGTRVGDWVIVGSGTVLRRLGPGDAAEILDTLAAVVPAGSPTTRGAQ
ncbi:MAG TPA: HypC/HybG/HupF family hydrogenase formation chaperone [Candidatus Limnocylindrales bacterium]|nr:HypC/HybG/HupF family hydrogenase formation chaperone [Candidatus Limnocylindrales bacterium]